MKLSLKILNCYYLSWNAFFKTVVVLLRPIIILLFEELSIEKCRLHLTREENGPKEFQPLAKWHMTTWLLDPELSDKTSAWFAWITNSILFRGTLHRVLPASCLNMGAYTLLGLVCICTHMVAPCSLIIEQDDCLRLQLMRCPFWVV